MSGVGPELLGQLLDEHAAALTLYARQWCRAPEDVVQEAFLKLVAQPAPPHHPVAWLYRVVRNAAISAQRAARRRHHYESAAQRTCPWFTASHETRLDGETATAALQSLPGEQREVIVAHLWGGLTFEQIAEVTGCSSSTAHRWYIAGLAALRERLGVICPNTSPNRD
jgi:RNA polymerase sigma-70 factor (ECF subfamily)